MTVRRQAEVLLAIALVVGAMGMGVLLAQPGAPVQAQEVVAEPTPALDAPSDAVTFTDAFFDPSSGWPVHLNDTDAVGGYTAGTYRVGLEGAPRALSVPAPLEVRPGDADLLVSAHVTRISGSGWYGLYCHQGTGGSRYAAEVGPEGAWGVFRHDGDSSTPLATGEPGDVLLGPDRRILLELQCRGADDGEPAEITFAANGQRLTTVTESLGIAAGPVSSLGLLVSMAEGGHIDVAYSDMATHVTATDVRSPGPPAEEPGDGLGPSPSPEPSPTSGPGDRLPGRDDPGQASPSPQSTPTETDEPDVTPTLGPTFGTDAGGAGVTD